MLLYVFVAVFPLLVYYLYYKVVEEVTPEETIPETVVETPAPETVPETEAPETVAPETPAAAETPTPAPIVEEVKKITTEKIVSWVKSNWEWISVIVTVLANTFYMIRKHKLLNKSISDTNHNAITVSENSDRTITEALKMMSEYKKASDEEKQKLMDALKETSDYLKAAKLANVEFSNELAELLVLANIPNSKKDELYARHIAAVNSISDAKENEVNEDDNGKKE